MSRVRSNTEKYYAEIATGQAVEEEIRKWRVYWKAAGPVRFSQELLTPPDDCPPYPDWEKYQETKWCEGCQEEHEKFNPLTGAPIHNILSPEQIEILNDLWGEGGKRPVIDLALVSAGRGSGKTLILACFDAWVESCFDAVEISSLAGSSKQSKLLQKYMTKWRIDAPFIKNVLVRSLRGVEPKIISNTRGEINFLPCSTASVRGPHVSIVQIDEACEAESGSQEGADAVDAIWYQIVGKKNAKVIMTSTTQFIFGKFYEYLSNPTKYGFKVYMWSIAEHISGKPPEMTYKDKDPSHWKPKVWWVTQRDIEMLRNKASDSEWLCEALGRPSLASGQVFEKEDMDLIVCDRCTECNPYVWGQCPLINFFKLGDAQNTTRQVLDRRAGFDYGDPAPCALTITGRKDQLALVLFSDEYKNLQPDELKAEIDHEMKAWNTDTFIPDPSIGGKHINRDMEDKGYSVWLIEEGAKEERVWLVRKIVERHAIIIPKLYWKLVNSCRQLAWDKDGKIRKFNDHSFDSFQYSTIDWDDMVEEFEGVGSTGGGVFGAVLGEAYKKEVPTDEQLMSGVNIWSER